MKICKEDFFSRQSQQGVATILVECLVGISIMIATGAIALLGNAKKEASSSAHAQSNAQVMSWAGVSAFNTYLLLKAEAGIEALQALDGDTVVLKSAPQEILAKNIKLHDCSEEGQPCKISAEISANNLPSQAAASILVTYELSFPAPKNQQECAISLTGRTLFTGDTVISSGGNYSAVTLNVDGDVYLNLGFRTQNISTLEINSTGDVYIDCGVQDCGKSIINVNTTGNVTLVNGRYFGDINALGSVSLRIGAHARSITSLGTVNLESGSRVGDVVTRKNIIMTGLSSAKNLKAAGSISLFTSMVGPGNVESEKHVLLSDSTVTGNVKAYHYIELNTNAKVSGSLYAKGYVTGLGDSSISHSASRVDGDVYADGHIMLWGLGYINGNVYMSGRVKGISNYVLKKNISTGLPSPVADFEIQGLSEQELREHILNKTSFAIKVDVRVYKDEANYIFTKEYGIDRVYLNKLKNYTNNLTYVYEQGMQYAANDNGDKELVNDSGFAIGNYKIGNKRYNGALCSKLDNRDYCVDDIIGYLPRISMEKTLGINDDYGYGKLLNRWRLRSIVNSSEIENAVLAPGIMYFEGTLEFAGEANWQADSHTNAYVNTFLAEGEIWAIAFSPRIYSPFNVVREGDDKVALVCNRPLKTISGETFDAAAQVAGTISNKYLTPTNLCANQSAFNQNMSLDDKGDKKKITIDGVEVDKVELGEVALMANRDIHIGACAQIYGDVLSRREINASAACGITKNRNAINGYLASAGMGRIIQNDIMSGTRIVVPGSAILPEEIELDDNGNPILPQPEVRLKWSKSL